MKIKDKRGFTLIEVIISMVVISIIMYAVIGVFITAGMRGVNVEVFTVAQSLAEGKLEQVMALPYGEIVAEGPTPYAGDLSDYTYEVSWSYVEPDNFDVELVPQVDQGYRKIVVGISHPGLDNDVELQSVRANY